MTSKIILKFIAFNDEVKASWCWQSRYGDVVLCHLSLPVERHLYFVSFPVLPLGVGSSGSLSEFRFPEVASQTVCEFLGLEFENILSPKFVGIFRF